MKKTVPFTKEINFKTMISKITTISLEHTLKQTEDNTISGYFIVDGKYKMTMASQIDEEFSYKIPVDIEIDKKYDISDIVLDIDDFTYEVLDEDKLVLNIIVSIDNIEAKEELDDQIEVIDEDITENDERINIGDSSSDTFLEKFEEHELEIIPDELDHKEYDYEISTNNTMDNDCYDEELNLENFMETTDNTNNDITDTVGNITVNNIDTDNTEVNSLFSSFKDSAETFKTYSVYIVKEDDTINSILKKYNIDKESLEEYNDLSSITTGSKVIIPSGTNE